MKFDIGDEVEWTSQAGGYAKTKRGRVVAVVPPGEDVESRISMLRDRGYSTMRDYGLPRKRVSFLVVVGNRLHWPRVSNLRKVAIPNCPECGAPMNEGAAL